MQEIGHRVSRHFEPFSALSVVSYPLALMALRSQNCCRYQVTRKNMGIFIKSIDHCGVKTH